MTSALQRRETPSSKVLTNDEIDSAGENGLKLSPVGIVCEG